MPPTPKHGQPGDSSIIVALIEEIRGVRNDTARQTEILMSKMESNQTENRNEFKEIREDIADMKARLSEGSEKMRNLRKDVEETKERCATHKTALERKQEATTEKVSKKPKLAWWVVLLAGGALSYAGERAFKFIINGLADPPAATAPAPKGP